MRLSEDQARTIIQRLDSTAANRQPCPVCGNTQWTLNDKVFEIREFQGGSLVLGGNTSILPVVAVSCTSCGYTHFLNAIRLGVVEAQQPANCDENRNDNTQSE